MSATDSVSLIPVLDPQGSWAGIWLHGGDNPEDFSRRIEMRIPGIRIYLDGDSALAIGIETAEQLSHAKNHGLTRFSGPFISHPPIGPDKKMDASRVLLMQLLTLVAQDADTSEIEQIFKRDPGLAFHLFRLVNSAGMGLSRKITSFNQAIMVLGRRQLQRWVQLLLFVSRQEDDASPLLILAAMRGQLMGLLAVARGYDESRVEYAFMAGIFSLLDSLLGMSMPEIVNSIHLPEEIQAALLAHQGEIGHLLSWIEEVHAGVSARLIEGLDADQCFSLQLDALAWALSVGFEASGQ